VVKDLMFAKYRAQTNVEVWALKRLWVVDIEGNPTNVPDAL